MTTETIDHTTLSRLAEAGAVRSAHVVGQAGGWGILVKYGMTERALAAQRSHQVRIFRKFETLVSYLKGVGIARFDVDTANYDPASLATARTRPDSAAKLKSAHEAAAYDKWLKAEIQEAIDDPRPNVPHEDVMRRMHERIAAIKARKAGDAPA
jgi:hypothetical protein